MKLDRMRAPALAAMAVLIISGAGIAMAHTGPASPGAAKATPVTVDSPAPADTDALQQGDQTGPDASNAPAESSAPEPTEQPGAVAISGPTDGPESPNATEPPQTNSDGAGGHADPEGQNVDHQFNGEE
jgi:hypothetical protein